MTKLSFIVPVYNVAPYLRKCVDSLLAQDYDDYEIILVDDGSTDDSPQICDELAEGPTSDSSLKGRENQFTQNTSHIDAFEDGHNSRPLQGRAGVRPPIRVIHQVNAGLSAARNAGILAAKGEYICFVDSDDYWQPNVLGGLMEQVERENLDVLRFDYQNVRIADGQESRVKSQEHKYEVFEPNKDPKRDVDYSEEVTDGETFLNERLGPACYAVMFVVKRSLLVRNEENKNTESTAACSDLRVTTNYSARKQASGQNDCEFRTAGTDIQSLQDSSKKHALLAKTNENSHADSEDCLFKEGIYFEDTDWTPRMLLRAKRVASTPQVVYNYLWRTGSITLPTDSAKRKKVLEDKIRLIRGFQEQSQFVKDPIWFTWMTSSTAMGVLGMLANIPSSERQPYLQELKSLHVFPLSIKREKVLSHKIKTIMANISPSLYCTLMSIRK